MNSAKNGWAIYFQGGDLRTRHSEASVPASRALWPATVSGSAHGDTLPNDRCQGSEAGLLMRWVGAIVAESVYCGWSR